MTIGAHCVLGFEGTTPSADLLRLLCDAEIAGVILFQRNIESPEQVKAVIAQLKAARGGPLIVGVDHEGGRVFRLPEPFTVLPPARAFGTYYDATGDLQLIRDIAERVAWELQAVGFNLNYAPVLDVDTCPDNPIIGDRAFHSDPERVAALAGAIISGFGRAGLACCGKHFPGHGDTSEDSHLTLPQVAQTEAVLRERELVPFRAAIGAGIPALMTAHVLYPALDAVCCGTLSPRINRDLLRSELGFAGVLCSDDLFMKGIAADATAVPKVAGQALAAGCDLILLCHDEAVQRETIARLEAELGGSEALQGVLATAAPRVQHLLSLIAAAEGVAARRRPDPADLANKLAQLGS